MKTEKGKDRERNTKIKENKNIGYFFLSQVKKIRNKRKVIMYKQKETFSSSPDLPIVAGKVLERTKKIWREKQIQKRERKERINRKI